MIRISFIVPVYNVESYLVDCVNSLIKQGIKEESCQILLINDGSTDNSACIADKLSKQYANVEVYHKKNGGLSDARNYGLKKALGQYIWFVDSDDTIRSHCLNELLEFAEKNTLDYLGFPVYKVIDNKKQLMDDNRPMEIVSGEQWMNSYWPIFSACFCLSKRDIWIDNELNFTKNIIHEDYEIIIRLLECSNRCAHFQQLHKGYYYYQIGREGSITTNINSQQQKKSIESWIIILDLLKEKYPVDMQNSFGKTVQPYISLFSYMLLNKLCASRLDIALKNIYLKEIIDKNHFPLLEPKRYPSKINYFLRLCFLNRKLYKVILYLSFYIMPKKKR